MSAHALRVTADNASDAGVLIDRAALQTLAINMERLRAALLAAKRHHYVCEDNWYSCPLSAEGCADERESDCNCGAAERNAAIDAVLEETA